MGKKILFIFIITLYTNFCVLSVFSAKLVDTNGNVIKIKNKTPKPKNSTSTPVDNSTYSPTSNIPNPTSQPNNGNSGYSSQVKPESSNITNKNSYTDKPNRSEPHYAPKNMNDINKNIHPSFDKPRHPNGPKNSLAKNFEKSNKRSEPDSLFIFEAENLFTKKHKLPIVGETSYSNIQLAGIFVVFIGFLLFILFKKSH